MLSSQCRFETQNGSKYLKQLCKHFAHKVTVEYDEVSGTADLPPGRAMLKSDESGLEVVVTAQNDTGLAIARHIIEDHLKRFAHREPFDTLNWTIRATN